MSAGGGGGRGCCPVQLFPVQLTTKTVFVPADFTKTVALEIANEKAAKSSLAQFLQAAAAERRNISAHFQELRQALESSERQALDDFDALVRFGEKQLEMQITAFQVKTQQFVAAAGRPGTLSNETFPGLKTPQFYSSGIQLVKKMVLSCRCWRVINPCGGENNKDELTRNMVDDSVLAEMQQSVYDARAELESAFSVEKLAILEKRVRNPTGLPFKGQCLARAPSGSTSSHADGVAINCNGTLAAVSDGRSDKVTILSFPSGEFVRCIGGHGTGPGQFSNPKRVCFSADGDSIVVAEIGNSRLQQVTLTGEHMRFLKHGEDCDYVHVDVTAHVIITAEYFGGMIYVIDYKTGLLQHKFSGFIETSQFYNCIALKLMPSGTELLIVDENGSGAICSLQGKTKQCLNFAKSRFVNDVCVLSSGEIAIAGLEENDTWEVNVYSRDGTCLHKQIRQTNRTCDTMIKITSCGDCLVVASNEVEMYL